MKAPLFLTALLAALACSGVLAAIERQVPGDPYTVGYSNRGLLIDGTPRVLTAGAIHYPRSTPEMWDSLMKKAKRGGLNTIDTYVFWNIHEPVKGGYDFATDRANLPLFLETARDNGLFVMLRIGPYVCAEWNYGGFPQWLRHEKDVVFRTYSEPFMREMKRFVAKVVDVSRPYLPEHGGPIIGMQIENELGDHQWRFGEQGRQYASWCGETAGSFNLTVPWIMCRQYSHVENVIPTQNDFYCDQYLEKYHKNFPNFPDMWTEMWPGWFQRWGEPAPHRPIEDISYAVAKWYAYGGTYVSYYMYQGGTNFGRTSGPFILTSYDYDGFLDEYGLENWPKYLHLAELHEHLLENSHIITSNPVPKAQALLDNSNRVTAHVYGTENIEYLAFLVNTDPKKSITVEFDGMPLDLHRWSVTLVRRLRGQLQPTILYNTARLSGPVRRAQHQPAGFKQISGHDSSEKPLSVLKSESIKWRPVDPPTALQMSIENDTPLEQISITDDRSDYLWYRTTVKIPKSCKKNPSLVLEDAGDVAFVYFDDRFSQMRHGKQDRLATFTFDLPADIVSKADDGKSDDLVDIAILSQTMGMAHNQRNMEAYSRGLLGDVLLCGKNITRGKWLMEPGLEGADDDHATANANWLSYSPSSRDSTNSRMRWYAIDLDAHALLESESLDQLTSDPENYPRYGLDLSSMTKGHVWINNHHLGRYWLRRAPEKKDHKPCQTCDYGGWFWPDNVCRQKCGEISQQYYHLPRSYLFLPRDASDVVKNTIYVFEELEGKPEKITVARRVSLPPRKGDDEPTHEKCSWIWNLLFHISVFGLLAGLAGLAVLAFRRWKARRGYEPISDSTSQGESTDAPAAAPAPAPGQATAASASQAPPAASAE
ncbi:hypothetical protein GGI07_001141 [Coemansia sp. Benny D115]|nr:hypothetical protein GGI07_001141 [Coemansia sp. Benny D115]